MIFVRSFYHVFCFKQFVHYLIPIPNCINTILPNLLSIKYKFKITFYFKDTYKNISKCRVSEPNSIGTQPL